MTIPKSKYPIASFGPELMEILLKAGRGEKITLSFSTRRLARRFQMRLHMLRGRMRAENHPDYVTVTRARTSLRAVNGPDDPATLVIYQYDSEFSDVLSKAKVEGVSAPVEGIVAPKLDRDPLEDL